MPETFDLRARPWINLEDADLQKVVDTVRNCPSGALRYELEQEDSVEIEPDPVEPVVRAWRNGPLRIRGEVKIVNIKGETILEGDRAALCRCGASRNKPFCDTLIRRSSSQPVPSHSDGLPERMALAQHQPANTVDALAAL